MSARQPNPQRCLLGFQIGVLVAIGAGFKSNLRGLNSFIEHMSRTRCEAITSTMASKFEQDEISRHLFGKECEAPAFFALYNDLVRKQGDFIVNVSVNGNKSIDNYEVLLAIDLLKRSILITKDEFFNDLNKRLRSERPASDIHSIINVAVQTMVMVDANAKDRHAAGFAVGKYRPTSWLAKETFLQFMERTLRATESSMAYQSLERSNEVASALKAWKLQKRLGAHFLGTTNLSEHLLLDEQTNCIYLFHHVGFLEAHLDKAQDHGHSLNHGMSDSLEVYVMSP